MLATDIEQFKGSDAKIKANERSSCEFTGLLIGIRILLYSFVIYIVILYIQCVNVYINMSAFPFPNQVQSGELMMDFNQSNCWEHQGEIWN